MKVISLGRCWCKPRWRGGKSPSSANRGPAYDYFKAPEEMGSGEEETHGGGAVKIQTDELVLRGTLSANGEDAVTTGGGGAGGSVAIVTTKATITGLVTADGGSGYGNNGGGGGGCISITYEEGDMIGTVTAYGGASGGGEAGAAGPIYINSGTGHGDVYLTNKQHTGALARIPIPQNEQSITVETVRITGGDAAVFYSGTVPVSFMVSNVFSSERSVLVIKELQSFKIAKSFSNQYRLSANIYVQERGSLEMANSVLIDSTELEICGILKGVDDILVRQEGSVALAYPAQTGSGSSSGQFYLDTLSVDQGGNVAPSSKCDTQGHKVTLQLSNYQTTSAFTLNTATFTLSSGYSNVTLSEIKDPMPNRTCLPVEDLEILNGQKCVLEAGDHVFNSIFVGNGGELELEGDEEGQVITIVTVVKLVVEFNGKITGIGAGYKNGGNGSASANSVGASYGGVGHGNAKTWYGSVQEPMFYGSSGHLADDTGGRGGGQLFITADSAQIDGEIDVSGADSKSGKNSGGSGGSILMKVKDITGRGTLRANGGSGGGGGGRVAVEASTSVSDINVEIQVSGGYGSGSGSTGTAYVSDGSANVLTFVGGTDEVIKLSSDIDLPDRLGLKVVKGAHIQVVDDITVTTLNGDDTCSVTVTGGATLTVLSVENQLKGLQCEMTIENGASLHFEGDLVISHSLSFERLGASYGGEGGNSEDKSYGSATNPTEVGSGTGIARGGGKLSLKVRGTCTLDGKLLAEGDNSDDAGGASGGVITIDCGKVEGHGQISVNGGDSSVGGGGGGGRVLVVSGSNFDNFHGSITSYGGKGTDHGAGGTTYVQDVPSSGTQAYSLYIDNSGQQTPARTYITDSSLDLTAVDLRGQAVVVSQRLMLVST
ncbi:hypothetical protein ScPMuIL_011959 [Solemya velum]